MAVATDERTEKEIREEAREKEFNRAEQAKGAKTAWDRVTEILDIVADSKAKRKKIAEIKLTEGETAGLMSLQSGTAEDAVAYMDKRREYAYKSYLAGDEDEAKRVQDQLVVGLVILANSSSQVDRARYNDIMVIEIDTAAQAMLESTGHYPAGYTPNKEQ